MRYFLKGGRARGPHTDTHTATVMSSLRHYIQDRPGDAREAVDDARIRLQLDEIPPRFDPDIRDAIRSRLHSFLVSRTLSDHPARTRDRARQCLERFEDTDVEVLARCAMAM